MNDNVKKWAEKLDGRRYGDMLSRDEEKKLKNLGLVVVLGVSDDLTEFCGAISDEVGCYDGNDIYVRADGTIANNESGTFDHFVPDNNPDFALIKACWKRDGYSWTYETDIPHESFDILDDGSLYCSGIIFAVEDMPKTYKQGDTVWFIEDGNSTSARFIAQSEDCYVLVSTYLHCSDFDEQLEEMCRETKDEGGVNMMLIKCCETYPSQNEAKEAINNGKKSSDTLSES